MCLHLPCLAGVNDSDWVGSQGGEGDSFDDTTSPVYVGSIATTTTTITTTTTPPAPPPARYIHV